MTSSRREDAGVRTLGVDGGGSGVRAAIVELADDGALAIVGDVAARDVSSGGDARAWIVAAADVVAEAVGDARRLRFGMGMPGRKTDDGRGIAHALHGPVEPRFLHLLELELAGRGFELVEPCPGLGDDGVLGCRGEWLGQGGALRGVDRGYYLAGGTGVAEAFVLDGAVVAFDAAPRALERAWRFADGDATFEERLSVRALNARYQRESGSGRRPEVGVREGDPVARRLFVRVIWDLVRLVWLREQALGRGFERVVVAQRLGRVLADRNVRSIFDETVDQIGRRGGDVDLAERLVLSSEANAAVIGAAAPFVAGRS